MTEAEWLACADPTPMLEGVQWKGGNRKHRLFAVACCRRVWRSFSDERSRHAIEVAERYADAQATIEEMNASCEAAIEATWAVQDQSAPSERALRAAEAAEMTASLLSDGRVWGIGGGYGAWEAAIEAAVSGEVTAVREHEQAYQAGLLRDIFGNPFHPLPSINAAWLTSNAGAIINVAESIYDDRRFDDLPILADALEAAGCTDAAILEHCRGGGEHVRGCWVVDLLLGKE